MKAQSKKVMMLGLVACFVVQTWLVYSDAPSRVQHDELALEGATLWHEQACQSCHQLHGFGGFLGPDLTNVASDLGASFDDRLVGALDTGPGQMPAYELDAGQVRALAAFLRDLDRGGVGVAHLPASVRGATWFEREAQSAFDENTPASVQRGFEVLRTRPCQGCHRPFADVPGGPPDLSMAAARLSPDELHAVLREGRGQAMPKPLPELADDERADLVAFLTWLSERRTELDMSEPSGRDMAVALAALPWWEYDDE
jgi:nitric oxide reductase subunit C